MVKSFIILNNKFYDFDPLFEQVVKIDLPILALLLPTIKMYNFIISEYYEYSNNKKELEQQKKEKYKYDLYNYD
ncbi:hypothetical protein [Lactobacillus sp. W8093]|uniref:hypothetical protein n=1 Tax=Lactobacillus sp. W8093 TaxID=2751038 RepID=UPI0018F04BAD|nr:hypothetical protein [Lactobacillus sp. W8093]MBI0110744.1 hypothetical protein [Lactobacillus sp. W8093]